ncbi:hypothetical protein Y032_0237g3244 [Ancylostoma ceylanicum]|uniref:Uncharacterized protein n=1 Tax=Ancylostoma ceylanicum TaxID=53326 RepID=A0A016SEQ7_9BILA|nr:hypothetical protein Y032_0237g3244 [Ancylostoma ceylanicum]
MLWKLITVIFNNEAGVGVIRQCSASSSRSLSQKMRKTCQCDRLMCRLVAQFGEVSKLLRPVMLNMGMTLTAWIFVYQMKTDERLSAMFLMSGNSTTGNKYHDGIVSNLHVVANPPCCTA